LYAEKLFEPFCNVKAHTKACLVKYNNRGAQGADIRTNEVLLKK